MAQLGSQTTVSKITASIGARLSAAVVALVFVVATMGLSEAQAKRMGGGGSIGKSATPMQRQATPPAKPAQQQTPPTQQATPAQQPAGAAAAAPAAAASQAASGASRWMAPLAGLAAGLGLAALASHLGLGEELMGMLMIVLLVAVGFFILRMVLARGRGASQSGGFEPAMARSGLGSAGSGSAAGSWNAPQPMGGLRQDMPAHDNQETVTAASAGSMSQEEVDQFLQVARAQFLSLQKLWDAGDLKAIESFCTSAMAQELAGQLAARGHTVNYTSVVQLEVEWMGLQDGVNDEGHPVDEAYVGFKGLVRETADGVADAFHEVWVLQKRKDGRDGWLLAGISQHS
ncbi:MAG: TIM44-like domain-containing protein [Burkholderiaceae bacterium]